MSSNTSELSILPDIQKKLQQYATSFENFSIYEYERSQIHWERNSKPSDLLHYEQSPICSTLKVKRDPFSGEIHDFREVSLKAAGATAKNSMSLNRAPLPPSQATRGSALYVPFLPGSFPSDALKIPECDDLSSSELLTVPPGFSSGVIFDSDGYTLLHEDKIESAPRKIPDQKNIINLLDLVQNEQELLGNWGSIKKDAKESSDSYSQQMQSEEESVIPKEPLVLNISKTAPINTTKEWAVLLDSSKPVKDFDEKVPHKALTTDFEFDTFQKLAIMQLEQGNHVFVAAHTSAGKTLVAEYAIALSREHKTRAIYTSPIKALSNQKYRDFKKKFDDVGLITGDFQLNETARCLIMTTEILKSMLYSGSDVIRDLEYVIFDEVHYINDRERGHVWEQVLIMLPKHVRVVLLSATVPNPEEFADWLGRTYQKKVYVITTPKRPVPLQHFLYTGTDGKTKNNRFLILNDSQWCMEGYVQAKNSMPNQGDKRGSDRRQFNEKQDKVLWSALTSHLEKNDLLPAVAFTFSRAKCDRNAASLSSMNLTSATEKFKIDAFYKACIQNLREEDRQIPQLLEMRDTLMRGIGIHHSGILPIIKEIVEMLFESGRIKLLFATETFAMGVNMPARTVIFDSITKHDGKEWRHLESAEYIQMAGRAGRRKLDNAGTVIILCKNQLPAETTLKLMMTGRPQSLSSQFRITYSMVLKLLLVKTLTVEGMMSRSFLEAGHQKKIVEYEKQLENVEKEITELYNAELSSYLQPLIAYFDAASKYLRCRKEILPGVFAHGKVQKVMTPGRVLLISYKNHINKLAMLLSTSRGAQEYKVFILTDKDLQSCKLDDKTDMWYKMISLASPKVFCPVESVGHDIVDVELKDILEISSKMIKVNTEVVIKDWNNRQIPRFKNDPPGQTTVKATQELHKISLSSKTPDADYSEYYHFLHDLHVDNNELYEDLTTMYRLKDSMLQYLGSTRIPNFLEQFSIVFSKKYLEEKRKNLKCLLSETNLTLYPDYEKKIALLKEMNYIDSNNIVERKGKVACQMGMNELLTTELVFRNVLKKLKPAEVAALLSTLVFQVRNKEESEKELLEGVTPALQEAIDKLKVIHSEIINIESRQIRSEDIQDELNLGLVMIIYNWASNKSFAEISSHSNYQAGIIVRCIQQLDDTICDIRDACKIIGDPTLRKKMEDASKAIRRDIVYADSLYTKGEDLSQILKSNSSRNHE
ncbi:hypothetical protein HHI36_002290 [Cryptolaemus montrouzieri]|uniref:Helicase SKI2W n=1 Tax=Cryptolaemus montrouzieri TaxID=559131 RepID=A0ABD2PAP1_9CUCU